jgi:hypothetical protein
MAGEYVDRRRRLGSETDSDGESTEESGYVDSGRASVIPAFYETEKPLPAIGGNKFASFLTATQARKGKISFGKPKKGPAACYKDRKEKQGMYRKGLNPNAEEFVRTKQHPRKLRFAAI